MVSQGNLKACSSNKFEVSEPFRSCIAGFLHQIRTKHSQFAEIKPDLLLEKFLSRFEATPIHYYVESADSEFPKIFPSYLEKFTPNAQQKEFDLGRFYDQQKTARELQKQGKSRNKTGRFYTPQSLAQFTLDTCLCSLDSTASRPNYILDPSCGAGVFLVRAFRTYTKLHPSVSPAQVLAYIFGIDLSAEATAVCQLSLFLELPETCQTNEAFSILFQNIRTGNALIDPKACSTDLEAEQLGAFDWIKAFPSAAQNDGFDIIVGNPPYGLSRDDQISEIENDILKTIYNETRFGKVNKYMAFIARSCQLLRDGGCCGLIVPNSWLGIRSAQNLRKFLIDNRLLQAIDIFDFSPFADPKVETVCVILRKNSSQTNIGMNRISDNYQKHKSWKVPLKYCKQSPGYELPTLVLESVFPTLDYLRTKCVPLGETGFRPRIALQAYATGKGTPKQSKQDVKNKIYDRDVKACENTYPYLDGSAVQRWSYNKPCRYLTHGPWLAEPQNISLYSKPRIVLREILGKNPYLLQGTLVCETLLYNKSILHISEDENSIKRLQALLAILNSKLGSFVTLALGRKSQRKLFPKIVNQDLKCFPLPTTFEQNIEVLAGLSSQMLNSKDQDCMAQIDSTVFELYQVPLKQQEQIVALLV